MSYILNNNISNKYMTSVALGNFDGLHRGHMAVIAAAAESAAADTAVVMLKFKDHPSKFLGKTPALRLLTDECEEKKLASLGVKALLYDFMRVKDMSPREFVEKIIVGELNAAAVSCGFNYRFGKNASGDAAELSAICGDFGVKCRVCEEVRAEGETVSSSAIRKALAGGDMKKANAMLGYLYSYDYVVVTGDRRGRLLGAPTINQFFPEGVLVPRYGVYASAVTVDGKRYAAVTNIGMRPTVGSDRPRSETYIEGFSGDLYGKNPTVSLLEYMRPEMKFQTLDELAARIAADARTAAVIAEKQFG